MPSSRPAELRSIEEYSAFIESSQPLLWIRAPIYLHAANETGAKCPCCGSTNAVRIEELEGEELLIDRLLGTRKRRAEVDDKETFDQLARTRAQRFDLPIRCYAEQLPIILDDQHKTIGVFGGIRSGKSTAGAEWLKRKWLIHGGPGAQFWWVAPTREKTRIGVRKLVLGERTDRFVAPLFPKELVASYPKNEQSADQVVRLIDGSEIHCKYAGRSGGNLKGDPCAAILLDEGCEVTHRANWTVMQGRLIDTGGQIMTSTTPIAGHWLHEEVFEPGKDYEHAGPDDDVISVELSCYRNPWVPLVEIDRMVAVIKDELRVAREIHGKWVGDGLKLWKHFDPVVHLRDGPWRDVEGWNLINITPIAARRFFKGTHSQLTTVAGMDFNIYPMSLVLAQIGCPPGLDQSNVDNWVLFIYDEIVVRVGSIHEFADFMRTKAGPYRKLDQNAFDGLPISCDATAAQWKHPRITGLTDRSTTLVKEMKRAGFDARPCWLHPESTQPQNPAVLDRVSLVHKLMRERIKCHDGTEIPKLLIHATRCPQLIRSIELQEADPRGKPAKQSNTVSDRLSGPTDALGYLAWSIFYRMVYGINRKRETRVDEPIPISSARAGTGGYSG